jgi:hypothetical protein
MEELKFPEWQALYRDALLELNPARLAAQVAAAEEAIFLRLQRLGRSPATHEELMAIEDALSSLRALKKDRLGYPDWNSG